MPVVQYLACIVKTGLFLLFFTIYEKILLPLLDRILLWGWEYFLVPASARFLDPSFKYKGGNLFKETPFSSGIYLKAFDHSDDMAMYVASCH